MKGYALIGVTLAAATLCSPVLAGFNYVGGTVDMSSGYYIQGGPGKIDRQALVGSDGPLNGTGSNTNVIPELYAYTDNVKMTNSGFYRYNWLRIDNGLSPGDSVGYVVQKLTNLGNMPDTYVLWGETQSAANILILAEAWNYRHNLDGTLRIQADLASSFPWGGSEPVQRGQIGAFYSTDWDGVSVDAQDIPTGTWNPVVQIKDFPDGWFQPFAGFSVPAGITDTFYKAYNGEGTNGIGQGQHPGQGYGGLATYQTAGASNGTVRGIDVYVRGPHGGFYGERRPTYGVIVPEPASLMAMLAGLGSFAAVIRRKRS